MRHEIKLESLGDDGKVTEATVSFWYYDQGEDVPAGEDLVEIVTDKATFNISAPAAGVLAEVRAGEGCVVKVGDLLAILEAKE